MEGHALRTWFFVAFALLIAPAASAQAFRVEEVAAADAVAPSDLKAKTIAFSDHRTDPLADKVTGLIRFEDEAQVVAMANDSAAGLAAYAYTRDLGRSWRVTEALEYGMVGINTFAISSADAPFGGVKDSGFGSEGGKEGLESYQVVKAIHQA